MSSIMETGLLYLLKMSERKIHFLSKRHLAEIEMRNNRKVGKCGEKKPREPPANLTLVGKDKLAKRRGKRKKCRR